MGLVVSDPQEFIAHAELQNDPSELDPGEIEQIAEDATEGIPLGAPVEELADAHGCRVRIVDSLEGDIDGMTSPTGMILARAQDDRRRVVLAILHEIAHHLLRDHDYTHGDVWLLTFALACPRGLLRRLRGRHGNLTLAALYHSTKSPRWALGDRLEWAAVSAA